MKINDLVNIFKKRNETSRDKLLKLYLDEISNYIMFEQTLIKKDNGPSPIIKYRYEKETYDFINDFFKNIEYISEPIVGGGKSVVIKDLPDELHFENKHEMSFKDKIFFLDKIKDSFMHLKEDETLYDIDLEDRTVVIKNKSDKYSLECKIPILKLAELNRKIKRHYNKDMLMKIPNPKEILEKRKRTVPGFNSRLDNNLSDSRNQYVYYGNGEYFLYETKKEYQEKDGFRYRTRIFKTNNNTASYVYLLMASMKEKNYPLLNDIYNMDFECTHPEYRQKMTALIKSIIDFSKTTYDQFEYKTQEQMKNRIMDFFQRTGPNHNKVGLINDISDINNMIVKNFLRNARSHANITEENTGIKNNPLILYHDVLYNSYINLENEKTQPSFQMIGYKQEFDTMFSKLSECSMDNDTLYEKMNNEITLGRKDLFEEYLEQLEGIITQAYNDKIEFAEELKEPIGNAENFVDFLRKAMNGTFIKEENKII